MTVQDDARERELLRLFNLTAPPERGRSEIDATLRLDGQVIPFELKSTTGGSISTVRDFGPDHIAKWKGWHWLFGFYNKSGTELLYCHYGSPQAMSAWIEEKERYVKPDTVLATHAPELVTEELLVEILGDRAVYTIDEARLIQKKQYTTSYYRERMDRPEGYTKARLLELLQERCAYLIKRGSTLNNPHIPKSYFQGWEEITEDHAIRLRELVRQTLGA